MNKYIYKVYLCLYNKNKIMHKHELYIFLKTLIITLIIEKMIANKLEKWFPLQGELAQSLKTFYVHT